MPATWCSPRACAPRWSPPMPAWYGGSRPARGGGCFSATWPHEGPVRRAGGPARGRGGWAGPPPGGWPRRRGAAGRGGGGWGGWERAAGGAGRGAAAGGGGARGGRGGRGRPRERGGGGGGGAPRRLSPPATSPVSERPS